MNMTESQRNRAALQWSSIAGEPIRFENNGSMVAAYGSELACLRLFHSFRYGMQKKDIYHPRVEFIKSQNSWRFSYMLSF